MRKLLIFLVIFPGLVYGSSGFYETHAEKIGLTREQGRRFDAIFKKYPHIDLGIFVGDKVYSKDINSMTMSAVAKTVGIILEASIFELTDTLVIGIDPQKSLPKTDGEDGCDIFISFDGGPERKLSVYLKENRNTGQWMFISNFDESLFGFWSTKEILYRIPLKDGSFYEDKDNISGIAEVRAEMARTLEEIM